MADLATILTALLPGGAGYIKGQRQAALEAEAARQAENKRRMDQMIAATELRGRAKSPEQLYAMEGLLAALEGRRARRDEMLPRTVTQPGMDIELPQAAPPMMRPPGPPDPIAPGVPGYEHIPRAAQPPGVRAYRTQLPVPMDPAGPTSVHVPPASMTMPPSDPLAALLFRREQERQSEMARKAGLEERGRKVQEKDAETRRKKEERFERRGHPFKPSARKPWSPSIVIGARRQEEQHLEDALHSAETDLANADEGSTAYADALRRVTELRGDLERVRRVPKRARQTPSAAMGAAQAKAGVKKAERKLKTEKVRLAKMKPTGAEKAKFDEMEAYIDELEGRKTARHKRRGARSDKEKQLEQEIADANMAYRDALKEFRLSRARGASEFIADIEQAMPGYNDAQAREAAKILNEALGGSYEVKASGRASLVTEIQKLKRELGI